jgi:hypothetical protein
MARSQLLKDVVRSTITIEEALFRLKVIFTDLDNKKILDWINSEITGYQDRKLVPDYRVLIGIPQGDYKMNGDRYKNHPIPLREYLSDEQMLQLITTRQSDSVSTIQTIAMGENRDKFSKFIAPDFYNVINAFSNNLQIQHMYLLIPASNFDSIITHVKNNIVDIILELEKQFENLDDLDIGDQVVADPLKRQEIVLKIENIIFDNRNSISIGDSNTITESNIGHAT